MTASARARRTLKEAERVAAVLRERGIETAVVGAIAAAVHGYPRTTSDLDLASFVDPFTTLRAATAALRALGYDATMTEPDAEDPLGGVVTIRGKAFRPIQIVNYLNPLGGGTVLGREALETALPEKLDSLAVVDLPHLIALKLYAGGPKSTSDVVELYERNRDGIDLARLRDVCARHGLASALERVLADVASAR